MKKLIITLFTFLLVSTALATDLLALTSNSEKDTPKTCSYQGVSILDSKSLAHRDINELSVVGKGPNEHLPAYYEADDLVDIAPEFITPLYRANMVRLQKLEKLRKDAYYFLQKMLTQAHKENIEIFVHSGYRSFDIQCSVFTRKLRLEMQNKKIPMNRIDEAIRNVNTRSAIPGTSEHQMGTAVDLVTFLAKYETPDKPKNSGYAVEYELEHTPAFKWLDQNAHNYGFVLSYPKSRLVKFNQPHPRTGYIYEPWHWRYIHPTYAKRFKQCGALVLSDFLKELERNPDFECNQSYISKINY